jgi:hypothetical protein
MKLPYYKLNADSTLHLFEFTSIGPNGKIKKMKQHGTLGIFSAK